MLTRSRSPSLSTDWLNSLQPDKWCYVYQKRCEKQKASNFFLNSFSLFFLHYWSVYSKPSKSSLFWRCKGAAKPPEHYWFLESQQPFHAHAQKMLLDSALCLSSPVFFYVSPSWTNMLLVISRMYLKVTKINSGSIYLFIYLFVDLFININSFVTHWVQKSRNVVVNCWFSVSRHSK